MTQPENTPLDSQETASPDKTPPPPLFPAAQTMSLKFSPQRLLAWSLVAVTAVFVPFSGTLATRTLAQDLPRLKEIQASPEHLRLVLPAQAVEGQPAKLFLSWQNLPAATRMQPQPLVLSWQDISYDGKQLEHAQEFELGNHHQQKPLIFQSPGKHQLQIKDASGKVWQQAEIDVLPYPASIFPSHWDEHQQLVADPERFKIWVNLHYDPKQPDKQRQYMQITYDNQILERLLVSSGAPGHDTPLGQFKVGFKDYYPRSARYNNTPMPFWSAINMNGNEGEYGFHSLEDGGYLYLLGRPASHGCIRMSRKPSVETHPETGAQFWGDRGGARWVYDRVPKGTSVKLFKQPLPRFEFQDYQAYLTAQAREAQAARTARSL